jgi:hypothetical protein
MSSSNAASLGARWLFWACSVAAVVGCTGVIGDPPAPTENYGDAQVGWGGASTSTSSPTGGDAGGTIGVTAQAFTCASSATPDPGPSPLRLLSRTQYLNTVASLFGTVPDLSAALGTDTNYQTAFGLVQPDIDSVQLGGYQAAAETLASAAVSNPTTFAKLVPCAAGADQRQCAQTFLQRFGALAYRTPITDSADVARHMAVYDAGATTSHEHGIELLLQAMLQAPRFLYRVELGTTNAVGANAVKLSSYEIAARLAYVIWDSPPDAALNAAAAAGTLATKGQVAAQLTRMLADPKGQNFVQRFLEGLVQLPSLDGVMKDPTLYPQWTAGNSALPAAMKGQAQAFFGNLLAQGGKLNDFLTSPTVFVNDELASFYGTTASDATFTTFTPPAGQASGVLTLPALLSLMAKPDSSWPIYRGKFVREALFCQDLPSPPPNVPKPPDVQPGVSTRERLSQHETDPACKSCHSLMDPIGFGFEAFDAIGHFRTTDGNQPVDASGDIIQTDVDGAFNGVAELGQKLAQSTMVRQCVARQWFRFGTGRYEQSMDGCSMKSIIDAFTTAGSSLNVLPQALVASDAFLYRRPIALEASP